MGKAHETLLNFVESANKLSMFAKNSNGGCFYIAMQGKEKHRKRKLDNMLGNQLFFF